MRLLKVTRLLATLVAAAIGLTVTAGVSPAANSDLAAPAAFGLKGGKQPKFIVCPKRARQPDTYALCYTAKCWTLDGVAYCKCDLKEGESISLPFTYREDGEKKDVCDIFLEGVDNGFTVSTYSPPRQMRKDYRPAVEKLGPPMALYSCPGTNEPDTGYSAQCEGGVCFRSTVGQDFPGLGHVDDDEIICSCPPFANVPIGFQMAGPWNCEPGDPNRNGTCCDAAYKDRYCNVGSVQKTGTSLVISSPTGLATTLAKKLTGEFPRFNQCR